MVSSGSPERSRMLPLQGVGLIACSSTAERCLLVRVCSGSFRAGCQSTLRPPSRNLSNTSRRSSLTHPCMLHPRPPLPSHPCQLETWQGPGWNSLSQTGTPSLSLLRAGQDCSLDLHPMSSAS